ncbi:MAG: HEAT repeat domain-containing protein [Planctomycetaceae bacterium]
MKYEKVKVCCADPCEIAELIYESQTACYARHRRAAVRKLGQYDCQCNPEILCALTYALNDSDERVRREAADEIGDMLRKNPCCCSAEVTAALTAALGDCDRGVRRQAEQALKVCGYEIVDGCCETACASNCAPACAAPACAAPGAAAPAPAPAEGGDAAPAPAPPEDPKAYFPSRLRQQQQTGRPAKQTNRLASLFGMAN